MDLDEALKDTFDVGECVNSLCAKKDTKVVKAELEKQLEDVQTSVIELINRDYAEFVNLSSSLAGIDDIIDGLQAPLIAVLKDIEHVEDELGNELETLEAQIKRRQAILKEKTLLHNVLSLAACLDKLESLVNPLRQQNQSELSLSVLERVANEFNQMEYFMHRCNQTPAFHSMAERIIGISDWIQGNLNTRFAAAIGSKNSQAVHTLLRIYRTMDLDAIPKDILRATFFHQHLSKIAGQQPLLEIDDLKATFGDVILFWEKDCGFLRGSRLLPNGIIVSELLLMPLIEVLKPVLAPLTSIVSESFQQGFETAASFINRLAVTITATTPPLRSTSASAVSHPSSTAAAAEQARVFQTSPQKQTFLHLWDTRAYATMRRNELAMAIEVTLSEEDGPTASYSFPFPPKFQCFHAWQDVLKSKRILTVARVLSYAWSPSILIAQASSVMWTFCVQAVSRVADDASCRETISQKTFSEVADVVRLTKKLDSFIADVIAPAAQLKEATVALLQISAGELVETAEKAQQAYIARIKSKTVTSCRKSIQTHKEQLMKVFQRPDVPTDAAQHLLDPVVQLKQTLEAENDATRGQDASISSGVDAVLVEVISDLHASMKRRFESKNKNIRLQMCLDIGAVENKLSSVGATFASTEWQELLDFKAAADVQSQS